MVKKLHPLKKLWKFAKKRKWFVIPGVILVAILLFIFFPKPPKPVATQKVRYEDLVQSLSVTGTVTAKNTANLTFPIGGTIAWVGVKKGDTVTQYQTLATLDERTVLKNLQNSLLSYANQRNTFDQTNDNNANNPLTTSLQRILATNQNNLSQAVVSVELQDLARQQAILTTPIAGIVTRMDAVTPGVTAVAGSTTFTVTDPMSTVFYADVDQADIGKVAIGEEVHLVLDAYPQETVDEAVVRMDFVSHTTANGGTAYTVETSLPQNTSYKYKVGMSANADIILSKTPHVLTVPLASIVDSTYVYVQVGSKYKKTKVVLGDQNDTDVIIKSGLLEGDMVVVDPTQVNPSNTTK